jgi:uncharacterized membrane protein YeiH
VLEGFDPTLLLVLNLCGTLAFGLSGALAAVRARLDVFGVYVLAAAVGLAGGLIRDVLIGVRPVALWDWWYLAVVGASAAVVVFAHPALERSRQPIDVVDAAGLSLFCVSGAVDALNHGLGAPQAVLLGALSAIGGGMVRDVLLGEVPIILRRGLYAVPALLGASLVVLSYELEWRGIATPIVAALTCFSLRLLGLTKGIDLPRGDDVMRGRRSGNS